MKRESLYRVLPVVLQNVACSLEGGRIWKSRYNADFMSQLERAKRRAQCTPESIREFQRICCGAFLKYARESTAAYRDYPDRGDRNIQEYLSDLPFLSKEVVMNHSEDFLSNRFRPKEWFVSSTSGTTGAGMRVVSSFPAMRAQWAIWWRFRQQHGLTMDTWCGYFGGRSVVPVEQEQPPYWRCNYPGRQWLFSAYHLRPETMAIYVEQLRRTKVLWLHGYPSILALLAAYVLESKVDLGYQVRWITTGAENLLDHQRATIERAFGVRPIQHYGLAEGVANISECVRGRMHVDEDFSFVEFVPVAGGEECEIVGTNFSNPAMPLIRYKTKDLARLSDVGCDCGLPGRVVDKIDGRQEDYVILANGSRVGRLDHIFKGFSGINAAQILQKEIGAITIRVAMSRKYTQQDETLIRAETAKRLGDDTDVTIEVCDEIPRTANGKIRFVISSLPAGQISRSVPSR